MSALSALLARDQVVPLQKLDEAIQRQVINGGDFETNLLEIGAISEDTLAGYCAALQHSEPLGRDEVSEAEPEVIARVPRDIAEGFRVVPVRVEDGTLVIAAALQVPESARAALEAAAGMPIEARIATPFRVAWALWKFYGAELPPRLQRLAVRLAAQPSGAMRAVTGASTRPSRPPIEMPAPAANSARFSSAMAAFASALDDDRASTSPDEPPRDTNADGSADGLAPIEARAPTERAPALQIEEDDGPLEATPISEPPPALLSSESARARIVEATVRDEIIAALLDFAGSRLAYAAAFVVQGDVAEGLDARGDGLPGNAMRGIAVPLDAPGAFRAVRERGEPVVGPLASTGADPVIKGDLGRAAPSAVALLPVFISGRTVMIVWCDNGVEPLDLAAVNDVVTMCGHAAQGFERLIVERKRSRGIAAPRASAVATDASRVTAAEISQRVAGQRGTQALRAMVQTGAPPPMPALQEPAEPAHNDASDTPVDGRQHSEVTSRAGSPPRHDTIEMPHTSAVEDDGSTSTSRGTMFARGGRLPIAVDIIGPLPGPDSGATPRRSAAFRTDPRREPDESPAGGVEGDDFARLVSDVVRLGALSDAAANTLLGGGEAALSAVFRHFPGPAALDRLNTQARLPPVGEIGPLLRLVVMFRHASAPHLIQRLDSHDAEQRYFATLCLGEVVNPLALPHLLQRLFDQDFPTRVVAVDVLRGYRRFAEFDQVVRALRTAVSDVRSTPERRRVAANALGELRDAEAVPSLIAALDDPDPAVASLARRSLVVLGRQDFGEHGTRWREWWERAAGRHRVEWLIEALLHAEPTIRHDASEELKRLTGQFFGYYFNLPRREREKAHQRYVEWWNGEGREKFLR